MPKSKKVKKTKKAEKPEVLEETQKSKKWLYWFATILLIVLIIGSLFAYPTSRNIILDKTFALIYGTPQQKENYNPNIDQEAIKSIILDFYHGYQERDPEKITELTEEPLSDWEEKHCKTLKEQDKNYKASLISMDNLSFEFKDFTADNGEVKVKRLNCLDVPMPFKFGETTQGDMSFKLKKDGDWKITNRTYNTIWVSKVY